MLYVFKTRLNNISENYKIHTDKYFLRAKSILQQENINPIVRYQIFTRKDIQNLKGISETVYFIKNILGNKIRIWTLEEGKPYKACQPIIKLEGRIQDLIDLETVYLGILSGSLTGMIDLKEIRRNAHAISDAAGNKKVIYFGARHFSPWLDEAITEICYEEGFAGCSTDIGAEVWDDEGLGTIPHALILAYGIKIKEQNIKGNPTVEATKGFDKYMDKSIPRIALIDTFNNESNDAIKTGLCLPNLSGVRIDTCGENCAAVSIPTHIENLKLDNIPKFLFGKGVTILAVWGLRRDLDKSDLKNIKITISSGFNSKKISAFMKADKIYQDTYKKPLFDNIGTGSLISNTIAATSDIVAYYNETEKKWKPYSKTNRIEVFSKMKEIK